MYASFYFTKVTPPIIPVQSFPHRSHQRTIILKSFPLAFERLGSTKTISQCCHLFNTQNSRLVEFRCIGKKSNT